MSLPIREELKSTAPAWFQCNLLQHGRAGHRFFFPEEFTALPQKAGF